MECLHEVPPTDPLIRLKRRIEQLKFYQASKDETLASVTFSLINDDSHWYYGIYRIDNHYSICYNFEGGCSLSKTVISNLDLDDLFSYLEKLNLTSLSDVQLTGPKRLYSWWEVY